MSAYIYTRTSTGEQVLGHHAQEIECRALATRHGLVVSEVISENISAATPPVDREGFSALLDKLQRGDVVLMWRRDRLGRAVVDNAVTERLVRGKGAIIITGDVANEDTPENRILRSMLDAIAEYERAIIIRRTRAALEAKRARGEALGNTPLGQREEEGRLVQDASEAAKIAQVRAWREQSYTLAHIQELCSTHGLTARGNEAPPSIATLSRWCEPITPPDPPAIAPPSYPLTERATKPTLETTRPGLAQSCTDLQKQGLTIREIALEIEKRGYRNTRGNPLSHVQIHRILQRGEKGHEEPRQVEEGGGEGEPASRKRSRGKGRGGEGRSTSRQV